MSDFCRSARHVDSFRANINALAQRLGGRVIWNDNDEFGGKVGMPKTTIVLSYGHDEL